MAWSCKGLLAMVLYSQMIKPTETSYFSRGFSKKIEQSNNIIQILDSSNTSPKAILLIREDKGALNYYWVDFDTIYGPDNAIRLKIVNSKGEIERYLDAWLVPDLGNAINYELLLFKQDRKGNLLVKSDISEHRIFHAGDMMGMHHFDIIKPETIKEKASFHLKWDGYGFEYSWLSYQGMREEFHLINRYSYIGELSDSIYFSSYPNAFEISNNHYIQLKEGTAENQLQIVNEGKTYFFQEDFNPFGGFGADKEMDFLNPILHSFQQNGFIENWLRKISFGKSISSIDGLRNDKTLKVINATIKSIGYSKFITKDEYFTDRYAIRGQYFVNFNLGYSLSDINDSLIFYYQKDKAPTYYSEFWARRKSENISETLFEILREIQDHYAGNEIGDEPDFINDTLKDILTFDLKIQNESKAKLKNVILDYYEYLNQVDLSLSAYNLIFIDSISQNRGLDKEKIYSELKVNKRKYLIKGKGYFLTKNEPKWIDYE